MGAGGVRRWLKHFRDGNTDIADQQRYGRPRTAATKGNKQKADELIRQDRRICQRNCSTTWSRHHAVQETMKISETLFPFAYGYSGTQNGWELLSQPPYRPEVASSDYQLFGPLKVHLRGHHYETDEAVQEAVRSWLRGAGMDIYRRGIFKILQRWRKCIDRDGDFVEK
jgi:hypothetical protein